MSTMQGLSQSIYRNISAKTASYQLLPGDIGTLFTNRGATGAVTFTLPVTADIPTGFWAEFFVVAGQNVIVATPTVDTGVAFNDAAADSVAFQTAAELIGGGMRCVWDGTGWLYFIHLGSETQTPTVAT